MYCCIHDPGLALFLAETPIGKDGHPGPLGWAAFAATLLFAVAALSVPA